MNKTRFLIYIFGLNLLLILFLLLFIKDSRYALHMNFYWTTLSALTSYNIIIFFIANYLSKKSEDKKFLRLIFINLFLKFLVVLSIPIVYFLFYHPEDNLFIIPYVAIYIVFAIFETWCLNKSAVMRRVKH